MFGAVESVWRMIVRYVSIVAAVYAAMRGEFPIAAALAGLWLVLTVWASHNRSDAIQSGWLSLMFTRAKPRTRVSRAGVRRSIREALDRLHREADADRQCVALTAGARSDPEVGALLHGRLAGRTKPSRLTL